MERGDDLAGTPELCRYPDVTSVESCSASGCIDMLHARSEGGCCQLRSALSCTSGCTTGSDCWLRQM